MSGRRNLTVTQAYRTMQYGDTGAPALRLHGQWLARCGFTAGQQVEVSHSPGVLVIRLLREEELHEQGQVHNDDRRRAAAPSEGQGRAGRAGGRQRRH